MSRKFKIRDQEAVHFVTFTTIHWLDIFVRAEYRDLFLDSIPCIPESGPFVASNTNLHSGSVLFCFASCQLMANQQKEHMIVRLRTWWICLFIACPVLMYAQESPAKRYREQYYFDMALAGGSGRFSTSLSWSHLHEIGKKKQRLQIGYGLRFTNFIAANKYFTTAPAEYTSDAQGLGTIFSETIEENIDTITTSTALTFSLNLALYIQYTPTPKIDIGCNIDVIGFSFGLSKSFNVILSVYDAGQEPVQRASPTAFNFLLTSDNDIGSLNSEFYARYKFNSKFSLRAGYAFLFNEYQTDNSLSFDEGRIVNDRYRYKASMGFVGVTYKPF